MRALSLILLVGCVRDEDAALCPQISTNDLAVTEVRKGDNPNGSWIEVFNTTDRSLDLKALTLRFASRSDPNDQTEVLVRSSVPIDAKGYAVFGLFDEAMLPAHIDYGFLDDFHETFPTASGFDLKSCGKLIDRVAWDALPTTGTFSLGVMPPTAAGNDLPANWCTDASMMGAGTPGAANTPCP